MFVDEKYLRKVVQAVIDLGDPDTRTVAEATGMCEDCVERYLQAARARGLLDFVPFGSEHDSVDEDA